MRTEEGNDERSLWTSRLTRAFLDALRSEIDEHGKRRFSDRTIARITAHLKTFAKWIHLLKPFRQPDRQAQDPRPRAPARDRARPQRARAEKTRPPAGPGPRDRRRCKDVEFADDRPRRKGYRPYRNRAIVYALIETGMRRAAVCNLDLSEIDFDKHSVPVREKGGQTHRYKISKEGGLHTRGARQ